MALVNYEKEGQVVVLTLNRPESLNAMNRPMAQELAESWIRFNEDPDALVAILTGAGRAFCAGMDLKERATLDRPGLSMITVPELFMATDRHGMPGLLKPVIVAVNGLTTGIGCHLIMAADLRVAAQSASFGLAETNIGLVGVAGPVTTQSVSKAIMMEMALTGDMISAQRAYEVGIVNRLVPDGEALAEARRLAERITRHSPLSIRLNKQAVLKVSAQDEARTLFIRELGRVANASEDHTEAVRAFAEKRQPAFKGR